MRGQLVNYIPHAPTEGPAVVDKEDVIDTHVMSPLQLLNAIYNLQLQSIFGEICIEDFLHPTRKCCWRRTGFQKNEASQKLPPCPRTD